MYVLNFLCTLPDGTEVPVDFRVNPTGRDFNRVRAKHLSLAAEEAVREAGLTTSRKDPKPVHVTVCQLVINAGELVRQFAGRFDVTPPPAPLGDDELVRELDQLVGRLPTEFHGFVRAEAFEHGAWDGNESVLSAARELVSSLSPCVEAFRSSITKAERTDK